MVAFLLLAARQFADGILANYSLLRAPGQAAFGRGQAVFRRRKEDRRDSGISARDKRLCRE
jgi:hypothetical protein